MLFQDDFGGGMDMFSDRAGIAADAYVLGVNLRCRDGMLTAIRSPELVANTPGGRFQGLYALGNVLLLFSSGKAYYRLYNSTEWVPIADLQLSPTAEVIWGCAVPQGDNRYVRKSTATSVKTVNVLFDGNILATPASFVVQDGINQPWLIFSNGTARPANTYKLWTTSNREYVPIGRQMVYSDGILFVVSPDGKSIYRSVTGRPLDFVVNVDVNGDKGGDAATTSFALDFNEITCLSALNTAGFFASSLYGSYLFTLDRDNTIFGEPTISQQSIGNTGALNQNAITEVLGDYAFIDFEGIKSFNAVQQLKFRGRNNRFSLSIASAFEGVAQKTTVAATRFDNYAYFAVNTTYGPVVVIYDELLQKVVSFDTHPAVNVKQWCTLYTAAGQFLYLITDDNELYLYNSTTSDFAEAVVLTRYWTADTRNNSIAAGIEQNTNRHKSTSLRIVLEDVTSGLIVAREDVDGTHGGAIATKEISSTDNGLLIDAFPMLMDRRSVSDVTLTFTGNRSGIKVGHCIRWFGGGSIHSIELKSTLDTTLNNTRN